MLEIDDTWASIGRDGARLALRAAGLRDDSYPESAFGADLWVDGGDVQLRRRCNLAYVASFCGDLERLHRELKGEAKLPTMDDVSIALQCGDRGQVRVAVSSGDIAAAAYQLKLSFDVDQTYLLPFVGRLRTAFPSKVAP